jgi:N-acetylmuramoyl-L-alanine amidase
MLSATAPRAWAQTDIERASEAYQAALNAETALKNSPQSERTRAEHLQVIRRYERVYLITPHTGYADDALRSIATLYEEIDDVPDAVTTLRFLIREYPGSRFIAQAREDIERLRAPSTPELARVADSPPTEARRDAPAGPATVENIRYWESQKSVRVVVDLQGEATFTPGEVQNPPRYFVDIHGSRLGNSLEQRELPVESMMLESIRVGQNDADTVRVVLDLVQFHDATIFTLRDPNRLIIDVLGDAPQNSTPRTTAALEAEPARVDGVAGIGDDLTVLPAPPAPATSEVIESTPEVTVETAIEEAEPVIVSIPASPDANGEYSTIRSLGLKVGRVVIDAGHGGHDTGTIGPGGLTEKELVLDMALQLKDRIEAEIGAEVVLTRGDDTFIPLETRTAMANQAEADLFISIHANSSQTSSIRGFETYFLNLATSSADREIAARENAASQASISELQDLVQQIMLQDKVEESRELASHIQRAMAERKDFGRDRGVKQAPFVVLIGANMPSILAEVSFISNPEDERLLQGPERRRAIVEALFDGVRSYSNTLSGFRTALAQE